MKWKIKRRNKSSGTVRAAAFSCGDSEIAGQWDRGTGGQRDWGVGRLPAVRYLLNAVRLLPAWAVILSESEESR